MSRRSAASADAQRPAKLLNARLFLKALLDKVVASMLLALAAPLLGVLAIAIRLKLGSPVFFRQSRPGLHGRPFELLKFRTMRQIGGSDDERLTRTGRFLRSWSLDELPELWNVLRGEMSLVGPRPLLMQYLSRYSPRQLRRHEMKPGLTGWAQVNGRNLLTWDEKFELDVWYVENWSLALDCRILLLTIWQVVRRRGITHAGSSTMPEFLKPSEEAGSEEKPPFR